MATGKFFHIFLRPNPGVTQEQIEERMNQSLDWFRYDVNVWIVYSSVDVHTLWARIKPLVEPNGNMFICEANIQTFNGWMPTGFWNWLRKPRR